MDPQLPQVKLKNVLSFGSLASLGGGQARFLHGLVIPDSVVPRAGTNGVAVGLFVLLVHLVYFHAVPPDVCSPVNAEQVLEARVGERDELVVLLDLGGRLQDFVVEGIVVEGQDILKLMPLSDAKVPELRWRVYWTRLALFLYRWPELGLFLLLVLRL